MQVACLFRMQSSTCGHGVDGNAKASCIQAASLLASDNDHVSHRTWWGGEPGAWMQSGECGSTSKCQDKGPSHLPDVLSMFSTMAIKRVCHIAGAGHGGKTES
jgi:hypothetical protein